MNARILLTAVVAVTAVHARADDASTCLGNGIDRVDVAACTRAIEKGGAEKVVTALHVARAFGRMREADLDGAIADCDRVLRADEQPIMYFFRGAARYTAGEYAGAATDFARAVKLDPDATFALWLYLARTRGGTDGTKELESVAARIDDSKWPAPWVKVYIGKPTRADAVETPPDVEDEVRRCEQPFYEGQRRLAKGVSGAEPFLQAAELDCSDGSPFHIAAVADLNRIAARAEFPAGPVAKLDASRLEQTGLFRSVGAWIEKEEVALRAWVAAEQGQIDAVKDARGEAAAVEKLRSTQLELDRRRQVLQAQSRARRTVAEKKAMAVLRELAEEGGWFVVVDAGPGNPLASSQRADANADDLTQELVARIEARHPGEGAPPRSQAASPRRRASWRSPVAFAIDVDRVVANVLEARGIDAQIRKVRSQKEEEVGRLSAELQRLRSRVGAAPSAEERARLVAEYEARQRDAEKTVERLQRELEDVIAATEAPVRSRVLEIARRHAGSMRVILVDRQALYGRDAAQANERLAYLFELGCPRGEGLKVCGESDAPRTDAIRRQLAVVQSEKRECLVSESSCRAYAEYTQQLLALMTRLSADPDTKREVQSYAVDALARMTDQCQGSSRAVAIACVHAVGLTDDVERKRALLDHGCRLPEPGSETACVERVKRARSAADAAVAVNELEAKCAGGRMEKACEHVSELYLTSGVWGTRRPNAALRVLRAACKRGSTAACHTAADLAERGDEGVPRDPALSRSLREEADAQFRPFGG